MAKSVIANGTTANDGTGDTLRSAATKINSNFSEIYTMLGGDSTALTSRISFGDGNVTFEGATADSHETTLIFTDPTVDRQIVFPNASGNILLDSSTNTLTNKTLTSPVLTTPQINDTSANHQYVVAVSELAADRTVTLPLLTGADEFTFNAHAQTLTNKTLTTPTINAPTITGLSGGGILKDSAGNEVLELTKTASAVNHVNITNNATNNNPKISAKGTDTNVDIEIEGQGTGGILLNSPEILKQETVSGNGALSVVLPYSEITKGTAGAYSLADGVVGQVKYISVSGAGTATITPANFGAGTTLALQQNETGTLVFDGTNWQVLATYGGAVA
jgi:hypothetical protein|tara:strand:- start:6917 stop:7918 length:1002 start_codon:yes stop_codon:yes gene_type:complete